MHGTDSNVSLLTAVWLARNSHLKLPVFKQRLQIVRREVFGIFKTTMVGDFCLAARFCTECNNFILEGNLGGDLGGTPQVSINFGIPNRCIEHKRFHTVLWLRQPRRFHDLVEPIHTFTKLLHIFVLMWDEALIRQVVGSVTVETGSEIVIALKSEVSIHEELL